MEKKIHNYKARWILRPVTDIKSNENPVKSIVSRKRLNLKQTAK